MLNSPLTAMAIVPIDAWSAGAYLQIILINVLLSADNMVVIGMAAAGLNPELRSRAIATGLAAATLIRIVFAVLATHLLAVTGLLLAGGLLLLWVCWKMYADMAGNRPSGDPQEESAAGQGGCSANAQAGRKTLGRAIGQIFIADLSMSLDNVLAVAGVAKQDWGALVFGLLLSVVLMGLAASLIARLLNRFPVLGWLGLAVITYVAVTMIYQGADQLLGHSLPGLPSLKI